MTNLPALSHILLYGPSGAGKSQLAAGSIIDGPQLIHLFDSLGNAKPYLENCRVVRHVDYCAVGGKVQEIPMYDCYDLEDKDHENLLRRIMHFAPDPTLEWWKARLVTLPSDLVNLGSASYIFDSLTLFHSYARTSFAEWQAMPPDVINQKLTDYYEDMCRVFASLPVQTICISHVVSFSVQRQVRQRDKLVTVRERDMAVTTAPGRMADRIFGYFSDVWYCAVHEDNYNVLLQSDGEFPAKNTFNAPKSINLGASPKANWQMLTANKPVIIWE